MRALPKTLHLLSSGALITLGLACGSTAQDVSPPVTSSPLYPFLTMPDNERAIRLHDVEVIVGRVNNSGYEAAHDVSLSCEYGDILLTQQLGLIEARSDAPVSIGMPHSAISDIPTGIHHWHCRVESSLGVTEVSTQLHIAAPPEPAHLRFGEDPLYAYDCETWSAPSESSEVCLDLELSWDHHMSEALFPEEVSVRCEVAGQSFDHVRRADELDVVHADHGLRTGGNRFEMRLGALPPGEHSIECTARSRAHALSALDRDHPVRADSPLVVSQGMSEVDLRIELAGPVSIVRPRRGPPYGSEPYPDFPAYAQVPYRLTSKTGAVVSSLSIECFWAGLRGWHVGRYSNYPRGALRSEGTGIIRFADLPAGFEPPSMAEVSCSVQADGMRELDPSDNQTRVSLMTNGTPR